MFILQTCAVLRIRKTFSGYASDLIQHSIFSIFFSISVLKGINLKSDSDLRQNGRSYQDQPQNGKNPQYLSKLRHLIKYVLKCVLKI